MSGFSVSEFMSNAMRDSGGYARPNWYTMNFSAPPSLKMQDKWLRRLSMNCVESEIPGKSFTTMSEEIGGAPRTISPVSPEYQDIQLNFMVSDDMMELAFFEAWYDSMYDAQTGNLSYPKEYVTDILIEKTSRIKKNEKAGTWKLIDAWPQSVGTVRLGYDQQNTILMLPVTIVYKRKVITGTALDKAQK